MLTDGMKQRNVEDKVAVMDVAELVAASIPDVPVDQLVLQEDRSRARSGRRAARTRRGATRRGRRAREAAVVGRVIAQGDEITVFRTTTASTAAGGDGLLDVRHRGGVGRPDGGVEARGVVVDPRIGAPRRLSARA